MSIQNGLRAEGIPSWPESIQFLLRSYPTPNVISEGVAALQNVQKVATEDESDYA